MGTSEKNQDEAKAVSLEKVGKGLVAPVQFRNPNPDTGQRYVADQRGTVHVLTADGIRDEPFLDLTEKLVPLGEGLPDWAVNEERGLLGLEFHPDYDENRKFYVRYSTPKTNKDPESISHIERLSEFRATPDFHAASDDSERVILEFQMPLPIHQAGAIEFGPDRHLYVAMGDGGNPESAQDTSGNFFGSIIRINVNLTNQSRSYSIPTDNPLVEREGLDELFAWGFRNPWRMSFDRETLYVADVGSALYEEINIVDKGGNYGWPVKEGPECIDLEDAVGQQTACSDVTPSGVTTNSLSDPVIYYPHSKNGKIVGFAIVGGYVYQGERLPALTQKYVFGDYSSSYEEPRGSLFVADPMSDDPSSISELTIANAEEGRLSQSVLSIGRGQDGELYVLTSELPPSQATDFTQQTGKVYRIVSP